MSKKKVIAIDINEILRARWLQFDKYYVDEFGDEGAPPEDEAYVFDFFKHYKWEDTVEEEKYLNEDLPDDINPLDYQLDENGESKVDAIAFETKKVELTAKEVYNRFMYDHFCFELFGSAPKMYPNVDRDAEKFYVKYRDQFDVVIVSKENWFTIQPTLFFLSKLSPRFKTFHFCDTNEEVWEKADILLTTDPELLAQKPEGKIAIKMERPYNLENNGDYVTRNLIDLVGNEDEKGNTIPNEEFDKIIGFEPKKDDK